ncbi:MAG: LamG-like jellyroll fold domain-containing protein, partial [Pseudomonadota bacterium]
DSGEDIDFHYDGLGGIDASDGSNVLDLAGTPGNVRVYQDINGLTDGDTYQLSFDAGDLDFDGQNGVNVYWNGTLVDTINPPDGDLQTYTYIVEAGSGANRLEFEGTGPDDNNGARVDNVELFAATLNDADDANDGDDTIVGGLGDDTIYGGAGQDIIDARSSDDGAFSGTVVSEGPIGKWTFTDGDTLDDDASLDNDAILQNGATVSGGVVQLDGVDDYVEIPHDPAYDLTNATVKTVVSFDTLDERSAIFSRDSTGFDGGGHFTLWADPDGSLLLRWQSTDTHYFVNAPAGTVGTSGEHDIQISFDNEAQTINMYVDGVEVGSLSNVPVTLEGNAEPWVLGASQWQSGDGVANNIQSHLDGSISHFEIYEGAYDPDEVDAINAESDTVYGGADEDTITADANDVVDGGSEATTGGADYDTLIVDDVARILNVTPDSNGNGYNG